MRCRSPRRRHWRSTRAPGRLPAGSSRSPRWWGSWCSGARPRPDVPGEGFSVAAPRRHPGVAGPRVKDPRRPASAAHASGAGSRGLAEGTAITRSPRRWRSLPTRAPLRRRPGRGVPAEPARAAGGRARHVARDGQGRAGPIAPVLPPADWAPPALGAGRGSRRVHRPPGPSCSPSCPAARCRRRFRRVPEMTPLGVWAARNCRTRGATGLTAPRATRREVGLTGGARSGPGPARRCGRGGHPGRAAALRPAGAPEALTVRFLDVGQGDATLIQHPDGRAVLFDGGPPRPARRDCCEERACGELTAVVATHASRDHHGGFAEVLATPRGRPAARRR